MPTEKLTAQQIRERPAYSIGEAARYLRMNDMTLATWALGRRYETAAGSKQWPALFKIADRRGRLMSFTNLIEGNVLSAFRRHHNIAVPKIRTALDYVRDQLSVARPLADEQFQTNGVDLFVERYGKLVNASRQGQLALREMLQAALRRIDRDPPSGAPIRLYASAPDERERSRFVAFDPTIAFGRPALIDSGVPIAAIAERFRAGDSINALAEDYAVEPQAIEEAVRQSELLRAA